MASTETGRGKDIEGGFTNTIADKSAEQAMLRKIDELGYTIELLIAVLMSHGDFIDMQRGLTSSLFNDGVDRSALALPALRTQLRDAIAEDEIDSTGFESLDGDSTPAQLAVLALVDKIELKN